MTAGDRDLVCLDALRQPMQSQSGAQPLGWILGLNRRADLADIHDLSV